MPQSLEPHLSRVPNGLRTCIIALWCSQSRGQHATHVLILHGLDEERRERWRDERQRDGGAMSSLPQHSPSSPPCPRRPRPCRRPRRSQSRSPSRPCSRPPASPPLTSALAAAVRFRPSRETELSGELYAIPLAGATHGAGCRAAGLAPTARRRTGHRDRGRTSTPSPCGAVCWPCIAFRCIFVRHALCALLL